MAPRNQEDKGDELSEQAYRRVRERILKGEYTFGMVLSRRDLANEFALVSHRIRRDR